MQEQVYQAFKIDYLGRTVSQIGQVSAGDLIYFDFLVQ